MLGIDIFGIFAGINIHSGTIINLRMVPTNLMYLLVQFFIFCGEKYGDIL
jgi:hypothetical protein